MPRTPQVYGVDYTDGPSSNAYVTSARQTRFLTLSMSGPDGRLYGLGAIQTLSMTHSNGGHFEAQASDDYLEIIFGMRQWSGTFSRRMIRGADMEEMALRLYPDMNDVDWRDIPMLLSTRYLYTSYNGAKSYEDATWQWRKCFVTDHRQDQMPNPTDVMRETITLIAAGYARTMGNKNQIKTPDATLATPFFSTPTSNENQGGSQQASTSGEGGGEGNSGSGSSGSGGGG